MTSEAASPTSITPPTVHGARWREALRASPVAAPHEVLGLAAGDRLLVVGAHPDDETLGAGATIADLSTYGVEVHVLSLTVGEAALEHVGITLHDLPGRRRAEFAAATGRLGAASATVVDFPDSRLREFETDAVQVVRAAISLYAPHRVLTLWRHDPHPDHQAAGRAAVRAATEAGLACAEFPVWAPHWYDPDDLGPAGHTLLRLDTSPMARAAKARALTEYPSQTEPLMLTLEPILPPDVLTWEHEILVRR